MRYVRYKTTVIKIVDELISDIETIKDMLSSLLNKEISLVLQVKNGVKLPDTRIVSIEEDYFGFKSVKGNHVLHQKCLYTDIEYLELNLTNDDVMKLSPKDSVSRWFMLDME